MLYLNINNPQPWLLEIAPLVDRGASVTRHLTACKTDKLWIEGKNIIHRSNILPPQSDILPMRLRKSEHDCMEIFVPLAEIYRIAVYGSKYVLASVAIAS